MNLLRLDEWVGVWSIDRRFLFETPGAPERFRGQATVSLARSGLYLYFEEGFLEGLGRPIDAVQRYWIRPSGEDALELLFAPDPNRPENAPPFVTLRPGEEGALVGRHRCGEDLYVGRYRSAAPDSIDVVWTVEGPNKRGRIVSDLRRASDEMGYA